MRLRSRLLPLLLNAVARTAARAACGERHEVLTTKRRSVSSAQIEQSKEDIYDSNVYGMIGRNTQVYPYTIGPTQLTGVLWYQGEQNANW